jgi:hypothetical protein
VHRPGGFTSQLLRGSGLRAPLLVKGDASGLIPVLGICLPEDVDIEHRATDAADNDERAVRGGAGVALLGRRRAGAQGRRGAWARRAPQLRPPARPRRAAPASRRCPPASRRLTPPPATARPRARARQVFTWDVARQEYGPAWSVAQWALYWRVRKGFADKPTAQDVAVGLPPGVGPEGDEDDEEGEEVDSKFVKKG